MLLGRSPGGADDANSSGIVPIPHLYRYISYLIRPCVLVALPVIVCSSNGTRPVGVASVTVRSTAAGGAWPSHRTDLLRVGETHQARPARPAAVLFWCHPRYLSRFMIRAGRVAYDATMAVPSQGSGALQRAGTASLRESLSLQRAISEGERRTTHRTHPLQSSAASLWPHHPPTLI